MFSRCLAWTACVVVLACGPGVSRAQTAPGRAPARPPASTASMDDDFAAVAVAVDGCRCPEKAKAKESLAAIQERMRQDVSNLEAAYKAKGAGSAGASDQAQTTPAPGAGLGAGPGTATDAGAKSVSQTQAAATPLPAASLATLALAGIALLVSAIGLFLWWKLRFRDRRAWEEREQELREAIVSDIGKMDARIPKVSQPEPAKAPMRALKQQPQPGKVRAEARPVGALLVKKPAVPAPEPPVEAVPVAPKPVEAVSAAPPEPYAAEPERPARPTGDALADYAYAMSLGEEEGEDWFREHYKSQGLSCVNLNDHRLGTAALYFESDPRGKFLMVEQGGRAEVLPTFGLDFASARGSLEGVFVYPAEVSGGMALARPAQVERTGDRWTLVENGEFQRG